MVVCPEESTVVKLDKDVVCSVTSLVLVTGTPPVVEVTTVVAVAYVAGIVMFAFR